MENPDTCYYSDNSSYDTEEEATVSDDPNYGGSDSTGSESIPENSSPSQKNYTVLSDSDLRRRMDEVIAEVSTVLSVPKDVASILLRNFRWSIVEVNDAWFSDEIKVRKRVGLVQNQELDEIRDTVCGICFEFYHLDGLNWGICNHPFCRDCWVSYIGASVDSGCITIRCPEPSCRAALNQETINKMATEEQKKKHSELSLRYFVEQYQDIKWCPAPECDYALELSSSVSTSKSTVSCLCSHSFCWNCNEEPHNPVDCETVNKWMALITQPEARSKYLVQMGSKPCPKCSRPIEKNLGCMHMTCAPPCKYEFCWICLGRWSSHTDFYSCNRYSEARNQQETRMKSASNFLYCFDRWEANENSKKRALEDLEKAKTTKMQIEDVFVVVEAWKQVVECRQILKWSYVCRYFMAAYEKWKIEFFDYLQGQAEKTLESLQSKVEMRESWDLIYSMEEFHELLMELIELTRVTGKYFQNLVEALENGLVDVEFKCLRI